MTEAGEPKVTRQEVDKIWTSIESLRDDISLQGRLFQDAIEKQGDRFQSSIDGVANKLEGIGRISMAHEAQSGTVKISTLLGAATVVAACLSGTAGLIELNIRPLTMKQEVLEQRVERRSQEIREIIKLGDELTRYKAVYGSFGADATSKEPE